MVFFNLENETRYIGKLVHDADDCGRTILHLREFRGDSRFFSVLPWEKERLETLCLTAASLADVAALDGAGYHIYMHSKAVIRWAEGPSRRRKWISPGQIYRRRRRDLH